MKLQLKEIHPAGPLYREELALRNELLRKPLGLDLLATDLSEEAAYRHFGLQGESEDSLLACLVLVPHADGWAQLRQMAVRKELQGRGLGRALIIAVEALLRGEGQVERLFLNARTTALDFYKKLGYLPVGEIFTELGIPHQRMEKPLHGPAPKSPK
jgi:predicted GNAT family N-acyltransferase